MRRGWAGRTASGVGCWMALAACTTPRLVVDAGTDAAGAPRDAAADAGALPDAAGDADGGPPELDAGADSGIDAGTDAGQDSGTDAGPPPTAWSPALFPIAIAGAGGFGDLAFLPGGDLLAASNAREIRRIQRSDGSVSLFATIPSGAYPLGVVYRPDDGLVYASNDVGEIFAVRGGSATAIVRAPDRVHSLTVAPPGFGPYGGLLVATVRNGAVLAIDPVRLSTVTIGTTSGSLSDAAFAPDGTLYVVNFTSQSVLTLSAGGVFTPFASTGLAGPDGISIDPSGRRLWVTSSGPSSGYVSEITIPGGAVRMLATVALNYGDNVTGTAYDGAGLLIYRTAGGSLDVVRVP